MAIKNLKPGRTKIVATSWTQTHKIPKQLENIPGGLYPLRMSHWATDPYRIANGWPVAEPLCDVHAPVLVSAEGEVLSDREQARGITTGAMVRWIADEDTWSDDALRWSPYQADISLAFETGTDYSPTFIFDYEYQIGNERFINTALNFDSDSVEHMWTDLNSVIGGAAGYSVVMCLSANSIYGNNNQVPYAGIWCPGSATPALGEEISEEPSGGWFSLTLEGPALFFETEQTPRIQIMRIADLLESTAPVMIAVVMSRPTATVFVGRGPSAIRKVKIDTGEIVSPLDGRVVLGRSNGDIRHTADMAMFDLGVYGALLTPLMVRNEFALLSGVYGGDK